MTAPVFQETEARLLEVRLGQGLPGEVEVDDKANHEIDLGKDKLPHPVYAMWKTHD